MTNNTSLLGILAILHTWKKWIIISVLGVGIITTAILFTKPDYYRAETVFYAANPDLAEPSPLGYSDKRAYVFGTNEDLDRLFSIVSSDATINYLIAKFHLFSHYHMDSTSLSGRHKMRLAFKDNYTITKSKYDAIVLAVEDTDPQLAADIANHARDYTDSIAQQLFKKAQGMSMNSNKANISAQEINVTKLIDSIKIIKLKYHIIDPSYQARALADEIVKAHGNLAEAKAKANFYKGYESKRDSFIKYQANAAGYLDKVQELEQDLSSFDKGVNELKKLEQEYGRASDQISIMKEKDKLISASYSNKFVAIHTVDKAYAPEYKSRPKRSIIILASMLIALLAAVSGILLIDSFKSR